MMEEVVGVSDRSSLSSGSSAAIISDLLESQNSQIESFARLL